MWLPTDENDISDRENCVTLFNEVRIVPHRCLSSSRSLGDLLTPSPHVNRPRSAPDPRPNSSKYTSTAPCATVANSGNASSLVPWVDVRAPIPMPTPFPTSSPRSPQHSLSTSSHHLRTPFIFHPLSWSSVHYHFPGSERRNPPTSERSQPVGDQDARGGEAGLGGHVRSHRDARHARAGGTSTRNQ